MITVVDIGSNTTTAGLFRIGRDGLPRRDATARIQNRLMRRLRDGNLPADAVAALLREVSDLLAALPRSDGPRHAVATSALRDARNRDDVIARLNAILPTRLIDGAEEGRLAALVAVRSVAIGDGAVVDQGGGSLQVVPVDGGSIGAAESHPLGAVRLHDALGRPDRLSAVHRADLRRRVRAALRGRRPRGANLVGIGGSLRALARVLRRASESPLEHAHGQWLSRDALQDLADRLCRDGPAERKRIPGLAEDRVDTAPAAAVVWTTLVEELGASGVTACTFGIREGLILDALDVPLATDPARAALEEALPEGSGDCWAAARRLAGALDEDADAAGLLAWVGNRPSRALRASLCSEPLPMLRSESVERAVAAVDGKERGLRALVAVAAELGTTRIRRDGDRIRASGPPPSAAPALERAYGVRWVQR